MALNSNALATLAMIEDDIPGISRVAAERAINGASDLIENHCNRKFRRAVVVERVAGFGRQKISVSRMPLESIASITYSSSLASVDPAGYRIEDDGGSGLIHADNGWHNTAGIVDGTQPYYLPGSELRDYVVTYIGGFWLPDQTPDFVTFPLSQSLPAQVSEACLLIAASLYRAKGQDHRVVAESIGNASTTYAPGGRQLIGELEAQLLSDFVVATA